MLRLLYNEGYKDSKSKSVVFGGKSYEDYEKEMLKKRPFTIAVRHGKRPERFYTRL